MSAMKSSSACVDASVIVGLVSHDQPKKLRGRWKQWRQSGLRLSAPALLFTEVSNAIYRYERAGVLSPATATRFLDLALSVPVELYEDAELHRDALRLARRFALPASYDAHYLALAERLGVPFWTLDQRLIRTVGGELPWVRSAV